MHSTCVTFRSTATAGNVPDDTLTCLSLVDDLHETQETVSLFLCFVSISARTIVYHSTLTYSTPPHGRRAHPRTAQLQHEPRSKQRHQARTDRPQVPPRPRVPLPPPRQKPARHPRRGAAQIQNCYFRAWLLFPRPRGVPLLRGPENPNRLVARQDQWQQTAGYH